MLKADNSSYDVKNPAYRPPGSISQYLHIRTTSFAGFGFWGWSAFVRGGVVNLRRASFQL